MASKPEWINSRVDRTTKTLLRAAAKRTHKCLSDFVIDAALEQATEIFPTSDPRQLSFRF